MLVDLAAQHAMDRLRDVGFDRLSESERILATVWLFAAGVANHGFLGYYLSHRGDLAFNAPAALRAIGANELATIAEEANAQFGEGGPSPDTKARAEQVAQLGEAAQGSFTALEQRYYDVEESIDAHFEAWYERHKDVLWRAA
jgi:hypothetical protein